MTGRNLATAAALAALIFAASAPLAGAQAQPAVRRAPAAARPLPPLNEPVTVYVVRKGDTLWGLGDRYFLRRPTYEEVRIRNGVRYVRRLRIGLELIIPTRLLRTEPVEARLGAFSGPVTVAGAAAGGAPQLGMILREGAVLATGANAFARVDLPDGSRVSIPSQSRVRLQVLHRVLISGAVERTFAVEAGRSESIVAPITRPQDNYFVRTPVSVSAVRGTDFRVGYKEGSGTASTSVVEGTVGVDAPAAGSVSVPARFGVGVRPGASLAVVPLLPAPEVAAPGRVQEGPQAAFELLPVQGAKAYRVQLGRDAGMQELFAEQTGPDLRFVFDGLPNGDYFLRATAIDANDIEGLPRTWAFERDLNAIRATGTDPEGAGRERRFRLRWQAEGEGARTYRVQVSREPSGEAPMIDVGGLQDTALTVANLPPGDYRWRVMSLTVRRRGAVEKWSAPLKFTVPAD